MKKIIAISALFLLALFTPKHVSAQGDFLCEWTGIECVVSTQFLRCEAGFDADRNVCESITESGACNRAGGECISVTPPGETCYACQVSFGGCVPVDPDNFGSCPYPGTPEGRQSCEIGCSRPINNFRCENNSCIVDPDGPYQSALECEERCTQGLPPIDPGEAGPTCNPEGGAPGTGIDTAIGCIPVEDTNAFTGFLLRWGIGIGGGIAFLLILVAGFQITTSAGDPKKLQAGRELLTAAIAGLLLLIFSVFLLRLIGVNILGIPEFGG